MMIYPSINSLLQKVDNRFSLVIAAAKRVRQLSADSKVSCHLDPNQSITNAIKEIENGKVKIL